MDKKTLKELAKIVGPDHLTTTREDLLCYSYDGSGLEYLPAAVAFPGSTAEVRAIMNLASAARFPVVPRGAGTGMTGGSLPIAGGLVMAMSRLDRIIEVDRDNQIGVVEPGVITGRFQDEVSRAAPASSIRLIPPVISSVPSAATSANAPEVRGPSNTG